LLKPSSPDRTGANDVLISCVNVKISDLDARKQTLAKGIAELAADGVSSDRMLRIPELPDNWGEAGMDDMWPR
jgi:hypothetical protein